MRGDFVGDIGSKQLDLALSIESASSRYILEVSKYENRAINSELPVLASNCTTKKVFVVFTVFSNGTAIFEVEHEALPNDCLCINSLKSCVFFALKASSWSLA